MVFLQFSWGLFLPNMSYNQWIDKACLQVLSDWQFSGCQTYVYIATLEVQWLQDKRRIQTVTYFILTIRSSSILISV